MQAWQEARALLKFRSIQWLALATLLIGVGTLAIRAKYCVLDPDLFWHLRVGDWIVQHCAVPHTGILSYTAGDKPWTAYSWGYEVLLSRAFAWFGLMGIGVFGVGLTLMVALILFVVLLRISGRYWVALSLESLGVCAFLFGLMPRPVFFSMALFSVFLGILLQTQRDRHVRRLWVLPLLFWVWANLHIQFVYGLAVLGLFVASAAISSISHRWTWYRHTFEALDLPLGTLLAVFTTSVFACCIGPYGCHLFTVVFAYSKSKISYSIVLELLPLNFLTAEHFLIVALVAAAFVSIGWRKLRLFSLALLAIAACIAFRTTRDAWFLVVPAVAMIADSLRAESCDFRPPLREIAICAGVVVLVLALVGRNSDFTARGLDRAITGQYPVQAANFIRRNAPAGPLYNSFDWGGFLTWYLPQYPVSVDGRNDLYGDDFDALVYRSEGGEKSYESDPYLNNAGVILLRKEVPLSKLLSYDPRFHCIYDDPLAQVFVPRR